MIMEKIYLVIFALLFFYVLLKALSYKMYLWGLALYMVKKGYTPPNNDELAECSKEYFRYKFNLKK